MGEQDNEPLGADVTVMELPDAPGHWLVEAIDDGSEGEVYRATFDGHDAEACAWRWAETMWPGRAVRRPRRTKPTLAFAAPDKEAEG